MNPENQKEQDNQAAALDISQMQHQANVQSSKPVNQDTDQSVATGTTDNADVPTYAQNTNQGNSGNFIKDFLAGEIQRIMDNDVERFILKTSKNSQNPMQIELSRKKVIYKRKEGGRPMVTEIDLNMGRISENKQEKDPSFAESFMDVLGKVPDMLDSNELELFEELRKRH